MFKRLICWLTSHSYYLRRGSDYTNQSEYMCRSCHKKIKFQEF